MPRSRSSTTSWWRATWARVSPADHPPLAGRRSRAGGPPRARARPPRGGPAPPHARGPPGAHRAVSSRRPRPRGTARPRSPRPLRPPPRGASPPPAGRSRRGGSVPPPRSPGTRGRPRGHRRTRGGDAGPPPAPPTCRRDESPHGWRRGGEARHQLLPRVHPVARVIGATPAELVHGTVTPSAAEMLDHREAQAEARLPLLEERSDVVRRHQLDAPLDRPVVLGREDRGGPGARPG